MFVALLAGCDAPPEGGRSVHADAREVLDVSIVDASLADASSGPDRVENDRADAGSAGGDAGAADTGAPRFSDDFSIGPYPSVQELLLRSIRVNATALDVRVTYDDCADQGIVLQGIAELLRFGLEHRLVGGEAVREELLDIAFAEIEELIAASRRVTIPGPGFGLDRAWDAFQDGTTNPRFTAYAWQSGAVALGLAELVDYLRRAGPLHAARQAQIERLEAFALELVAPWDSHATFFTEAGQVVGYYWYSTEAADAMAVHNTSVMIGMAKQLLIDVGLPVPFPERPRAVAALLRARARPFGTDSLIWNYVDDGYPEQRRRPEDVEHVKTELQFIRYAAGKGWWTPEDIRRVTNMIFEQMWTGNPSRMSGLIDGMTLGAEDYVNTTSALMGLPAMADAPGGRPELFDYVRSVMASAYLFRFDRTPELGTVDAARVAALSRLLLHRPAAFLSGSRWVGLAADDPGTGPLSFGPGFGAPVVVTAGLPLSARTALAGGGALVLTLPDGEERRIVVSLTYDASGPSLVDLEDGLSRRRLVNLVPTIHEDGIQRWMRTSFMIPSGPKLGVGGTSGAAQLRLWVGAGVSVHQIEATPID